MKYVNLPDDLFEGLLQAMMEPGTPKNPPMAKKASKPRVREMHESDPRWEVAAKIILAALESIHDHQGTLRPVEAVAETHIDLEIAIKKYGGDLWLIMELSGSQDD